MISIILKLLLIFANKLKKVLVAIPVIKNGIPNPKEYAERSRIPSLILFLVAAKVRTPAKIGPIQGVQPNANASPATKTPKNPSLLDRILNLFS